MEHLTGPRLTPQIEGFQQLCKHLDPLHRGSYRTEPDRSVKFIWTLLVSSFLTNTGASSFKRGSKRVGERPQTGSSVAQPAASQEAAGRPTSRNGVRENRALYPESQWVPPSQHFLPQWFHFTGRVEIQPLMAATQPGFLTSQVHTFTWSPLASVRAASCLGGQKNPARITTHED